MSNASFPLDEDLHEKLDSTAFRLNKTKGWLINQAVRQYIEREELKARILSETELAIADIQAKRIISGEEVLNWLKTWGTATESKAPQYGN
jgi:predicted transcriptional regulator